MNEDFWNSYNSGFVYSDYEGEILKPIKLEYSEVKIMYANKLNILQIDASFDTFQDILIYNPIRNLSKINGITISIKVSNHDNHLEISDRKNRINLIKYAYNLASKMLGVKINSKIIIQDKTNESDDTMLITTVCLALNELYGNPLKREEILDYIAKSTGKNRTIIRNNLNLDQIVLKRVSLEEDVIKLEKKSVIGSYFNNDFNMNTSNRIIVKSAPYNLKIDSRSNQSFTDDVYKCSFFVNDKKD